MPKFQKRPDTVEAVQWDGKNISEIRALDSKDISSIQVSGKLIFLKSLEEMHQAYVGDWIMKCNPTDSAQYYLAVCSDDIFNLRYEKIPE